MRIVHISIFLIVGLVLWLLALRSDDRGVGLALATFGSSCLACGVVLAVMA